MSVVKNNFLNSSIKIGLVGPERLCPDLIYRLKSDPDLNLDFLVLDKQISNRKKLEECFPNKNFFTNEDDLFTKSIDGVILADYINLQLAKYQPKLKKIKALFCSANFLCLENGVKDLFALSKKNNILIDFDLPFRSTRGFLQLHNSIRRGEIGKVRQVDLTFYKPIIKDRSSSKRNKTNFYGAFMETGIHLLDLALKSLNYPEIEEITIFPYKRGKKIENQFPFCEDYLFATFLTKRSTLINLRCSCSLPRNMPQKIEANFHGEKGNLRLQNQANTEFDLMLEEFKDDFMNLISTPPDSYLDGGIKNWIWNLKQEEKYYPSFEKEMLALAAVVKRIYQPLN